MGERVLACSELGEQRLYLGAAQPAQRDLGLVDAGQGLRKYCSPARTRPVAGSASSSRSWLCRWQRRHAPATSRSPVPQAGQVFHWVPGAAQLPHSGWSRVPARSCLGCPHCEQGTRDRAHARHHGWPVILETMPGLACPQIAQERIFRGTQVGQSGPSDVRPLRPPAAAAGAPLEVGRVGAQAVRADRLALLVAGRWFAHRSAPAARDGISTGAAGAADPQPVQQLAQRDDTSAARAGGPLDSGRPGIAERADQSQHHGERRLRPAARQQRGRFLQCPRQLLQVRRLGHGRLERRGHRAGRQARVGRGDDLGEHVTRIAGVLVGALAAAGPAMPVPRGDLPHIAARGAGQRAVETRRAVPVVPAALHRGDLPSAARAPRRRDPGRPGGSQCQQQITDGPRCR